MMPEKDSAGFVITFEQLMILPEEPRTQIMFANAISDVFACWSVRVEIARLSGH